MENLEKFEKSCRNCGFGSASELPSLIERIIGLPSGRYNYRREDIESDDGCYIEAIEPYDIKEVGFYANSMGITSGGGIVARDGRYVIARLGINRHWAVIVVDSETLTVEVEEIDDLKSVSFWGESNSSPELRKAIVRSWFE